VVASSNGDASGPGIHRPSPETAERLAVISAGHTGDESAARAALRSDIARVRASALVALERMGRLDDDTLARAVDDPADAVRRTCARLCTGHPGVPLSSLLTDDDLYVAEMAAWAHGERPVPDDGAFAMLVRAATDDERPLVREAAVAALGALGDPRGLPAILAGCRDKPAVRRRAILALAPFDGPDVEAALHAALEDRDWQVRQNAEDMVQDRRGG
jgi:HEAT repeat protein